jgi:SAM-dependent methyltransferase
MQSAYLPQREERFSLILRLPEFPPDAALRILDLGCGPGSLSFRALDRFPRAHVVAVDADPRLPALGERAFSSLVGSGPGRVTFLRADLRDAGWWRSYGSSFDLVMSSTALHWLNKTHLSELYGRVLRVLKPGGWFLNADHIAGDDPQLQARYRRLLRERQRANFDAADVDDWDSFWREFESTLTGEGIRLPAVAVDWWEGSDDGLPRGEHVALLRDTGYECVAVHWQYLGEALLGAIKPTP